MKTIRLSLIALFCIVATVSQSQNIIPLIGNDAPSFEAKTTKGKLEFPHDFGKSWKILLSHPKDFTPVCTSEILELARMQEEFQNLNVKIAIISTDDLLSHQQWVQSMEDILLEENGSPKIDFPLIDDSKAKISNKYGMLHAWGNTKRDVRGVFVVDPDNKIQAINFYPLNIGRNMVEIKRLIVALQYSKQENVLTPVNWRVGDDVLMPYMPNINPELSSNVESENDYYKVGINLWYKKGNKESIPIIGN